MDRAGFGVETLSATIHQRMPIGLITHVLQMALIARMVQAIYDTHRTDFTYGRRLCVSEPPAVFRR